MPKIVLGFKNIFNSLLTYLFKFQTHPRGMSRTPNQKNLPYFHL